MGGRVCVDANNNRNLQAKSKGYQKVTWSPQGRPPAIGVLDSIAVVHLGWHPWGIS
jgi:hypothetical protein